MVDCNICAKAKTYCDRCIHNPTLVDHYIEVNELNSLFKGAPIIYEYVNRSHVPPSVRIEHTTYTGELPSGFGAPTVRLPTLEEASENVWLVPWLEQPTGLSGLTILTKDKNGRLTEYNNMHINMWKDLKALMIIGDL